MSAENHGLLSVTAELAYLSRTTDAIYTVRISPDAGESCNCESGIYRGTCWHLGDAEERLAAAAYPPPAYDPGELAAALGLS